MSLQADLNRLAATTGLDAQRAANVLAGTTGLDLVGALNVAAGTRGLELNAVVRLLAATYGGTATMDSGGALGTAIPFGAPAVPAAAVGAVALAAHDAVASTAASASAGAPTAAIAANNATVTAVAGGFTINPTSGSGNLLSASSTSYSLARSGENLVASPTGSYTIGQYLVPDDGENPDLWYVYESFMDFDTSAVTGTISSVTLSLGLASDESVNDFTIEARLYNWGASLTTADWIAGASLGGNTLLATLSTSGIGSAGSYKAMTESGTNFRTNINTSGVTRIVLCSDRHRLGTTPPDHEFVNLDSYDSVSLKPKLVIVTT